MARSNLMVMNISHLLFVDDTIVFYDNDYELVVNFHCVVTWFEAVLGLRVDLAKTCILPIRHMDNIRLLAGVLGCIVDSFRGAYLVSLLVRDSRRNLFGSQLLTGLRKDFQGQSLNTYQKEED